jgi:RNA polymerase sigma factor (sigma-70 family)
MRATLDPGRILALATTIARRRGLGAADARELAAEVLADVVAAQQRGPIRHLRGLVWACVARRVADRARKWGRRVAANGGTAPVTVSLDTLLASAEPRMEGDLDAIEARVAVERALARLPREAADLLVRHYLRGESQAEIARALGVTQQAVSQRLARAARLFRDRYTKASPQRDPSY